MTNQIIRPLQRDNESPVIVRGPLPSEFPDLHIACNNIHTALYYLHRVGLKQDDLDDWDAPGEFLDGAFHVIYERFN